MAEVKVKITLYEKDILEIIAEKYGLDLSKSYMDIYKYDGNERESSYAYISIEGELINK